MRDRARSHNYDEIIRTPLLAASLLGDTRKDRTVLITTLVGFDTNSNRIEKKKNRTHYSNWKITRQHRKMLRKKLVKNKTNKKCATDYNKRMIYIITRKNIVFCCLLQVKTN